MSLQSLSAITLLNLSADPASGSVGDIYYNTATGKVRVCTNATGPVWADAATTAAVSSVGLSLPSIFTVSNSPVTTTGTLTATLASQSANRIFAGPDGVSGLPTFRSLVAADIPSVAVPGGTVRVIAGTFNGAKGPAKTFTPIELYDVRLKAGASVSLAVGDGYAGGLFVSRGSVVINGREAAAEDLVVLDRQGDEVVIEASEDAVVLVMSGAPIDEPIAGYGPFVMNTQQEIHQAIADLRAGRMGRIPEHAE